MAVNQQYPTIEIILEWMDSIAPFAQQEDFDNSGFQIGSKYQKVSKILLCLDVTQKVIQEAIQMGAELIISHHPLLFSPLRQIDTDEFIQGLVASLLKNNISLISGHTNFDQSTEFSASAVLAENLKLSNIRQKGTYVFIKELPHPVSSDELQHQLTVHLGNPVKQYTDDIIQITTLALAGGAYSEGFKEAKQAGAQAYLTGEVRHHHAVEAAVYNMVLFEGGHFATEQPMLSKLAAGLQESMNALQLNVQVFVSRQFPYCLR